MSNGGIQRIRIEQVKQYYNTFKKEYRYFSDTTYNTFKSSYIKRCSDSYISQLASKLTIPYETLEKGYKKIANWWDDYNDAILSLEKSLSQDNRSHVSEASTNSYVQSKLKKLENYKNVLSREINPNIVKTSSPVFENNNVITNVDVTDNIASEVSVDSNNVQQQINNTEIYESMNTSIDTGADISASTSVLSDKVVEQSNKVSDFFKSLYETGANIVENVKSKLNNLIIRALYGSQELEAGYFKSICELLSQNNYSTKNLEKLYNSGNLIFEYQMVNGQAVISRILLSDKSSISATNDYLVVEKENGSRWQYGELYNYVKDVSGRVLKLTKDNQLVAIYNNKIGNVDIFDDFAQCGGDQMYFSKCNSEVVNDSKYLQLLQEYFPDATLEDVEAFAYALTNVGCGYVAHANAIFKAFEGNEGGFLETFGYPMYKVNNDGSLEPNISYLVFELVAHCHTGPGADLKKIYGNSVEVEHQDQSQGEVGFNGLMRGLQAGMVGIIQSFAEKHGISSEVVLDNKTIKVRESLDTYYKYVEQGYDVFLTVQGFTLYEYDPVNNVALDNKLYESAGGHAMSIIGITEDGRYVVSSWGKEFVCDLSNTDSVVFPSFNIIKYQTSAEQSTSKRVFIDSSIEESDIGTGKVSTSFKEVTSATEAIVELTTDTSTGSAEITDVKSLWQKFKVWINNDIKKSDVSFKVVDENYNNQLSSMTSELESYEELYNTYIDKYNEVINELSIYQNELKTAKAMLMSGAGMPYAAISQNGQNNYNKVMSQIIKEYGSYDNYKDKIDSLKGELSTFETALDEIKKQKELLKYGCLEYASEFENYIYKDNINYEEIAFFDEDMCAMLYYNEDTDGNPLQYMKAAINNLEHPENISYNSLPEYDQKLFNLIELSKIDPSLEKTYNFLYDKYGLEVANKYLNDTQDTVNNILGQKYAAEFLETLNNVTDEKEISELVANHIKTSGKGLGKGLESFSGGMSNSLNAILAMFTDYKPSTSYTVGEYETMYIVQALQSGDYGGGLVANYEISQGIGNMLPSVLLQSNWLMGISAAGNSYHSALVEGYSNLESLTYGLISGSSEAILEKFLGGLPGVGKDIKVSNVKSFLSAIASEGVEEGVQTITDAYVRKFLFSENIDPSQLSEDVIKSIKYGMITAGIMQGGAYSVKGLSGISQMASNVEQNVTDVQTSSIQKTFAEQINEVNYHSTKGDLLSHTFELNSIDEVTSELLNKIVDPSIVKFKIGDEIYDYIDIKKACLQNPEPILNNTEVQHITSFEKLPEALKQYLSNLLKNENGDFMSVKRLSDIFANAYENGDVSTKKIVENFPFLSEILNISYLDSLSSGASAFFASDMLFGDKKAVIHNEVGFGNDIVFSHEIGHALLQMVDGIKLPENYNSVMENLLKNWQVNPEQLESFLETARARQEDIWSRVKETTSEWMDANSSDIDKRINEVINDKAKLEEELRNSAKRNFVSNSRIDEEVQKLMSDNDLNQISDYIKKSYGTERMWSDFIYECDADSTMKIYRIVLGLIDSAYNGNNPYYSTFYDNGFLRSHDKDYFSKDKNSSFNEQFADFVSIKLADIPEAYQITKMLFGEEWINMMEGKYSQIANNMEEKISNYTPGSIDDLFNLDDLMLFNESVFKRVGDFFGKNTGIDAINNNKSSAQNLSESKILSKTFAEQINEANYYSTKGNLLSYTFELNSIDEVTTELLNKIIDPSIVKFKIGDEIYSYIDMKAELGLISSDWSSKNNSYNRQMASILNTENSIPNSKNAKNIGEIGELAYNQIQEKVQQTFNNKIDILKMFEGILASPLTLVGRFKYDNVTTNNAMYYTIMNQGLYHFTTPESAQKILDSQYVKKSDYFTSYGAKKSFFFAGIPKLEELAVNVRNFEAKRVAVKFEIDTDELDKFTYRKYADNAVAYLGDYHFDPSNASIVYLGLFEEDGNLVYKEISKEEWDNYTPDISSSKITTSLNNCKNLILGLSREYDYLMNNINLIKDTLNKYNPEIIKEKINDIFKNITGSFQNLFNNYFTNPTNLKDEIKELIDTNMDEISKARKLYIELNKRVTYDMNFIKGDTNTRESIYNKELTFAEFSGKNVICKGWSELYRELLIDCGFDPDRIKIIGNDASMAHRWVEIDFGDKIIIADGTEAINGSVDLNNCKYGNKTNGFLYTSKEWQNFRLKNIKDTTFFENNDQWTKIDENIGYNNGKYFKDILAEANSVFKNSKSYKNLMSSYQVDDIINRIFNYPVPSDLDGYECYGYYKTILKATVDNIPKEILNTIKSDFQLNLGFHRTTTGWEGVTVMKHFSSTYDRILVYSESLGKREFNSIEDFEKFCTKEQIEGK